MRDSLIPFFKQFDKRIVKSVDCVVYDSDGKQYIDFESGDWSANLGHSNPRITQVIKTQIDRLIHDGLSFRNYESEELSNHLLLKLGLTNGKSTFLNSGSEAVNLAITIAKRITGRNRILRIGGTYLSSFGHGINSPENNTLLDIEAENISALRKIDFNDIAAFVFEPGNSWGLIKFVSEDFIHAVIRQAKDNGTMVIANEVTTGFGRTGKWFGFQHYNFIPDIVTTGKGLGNGYPISAVSISQSISELFIKKYFRYAQSHQNDPLGCAIGLEVIKVFDDEHILEQCSQKGEYFKKKLLDLQSDYPKNIKEVRARGLMLAIEFTSKTDVESIYLQVINKGFIIGFKEKVLRFMPPLTIDISSIDKLLIALRESINEYLSR